MRKNFTTFTNQRAKNVTSVPTVIASSNGHEKSKMTLTLRDLGPASRKTLSHITHDATSMTPAEGRNLSLLRRLMIQAFGEVYHSDLATNGFRRIEAALAENPALDTLSIPLNATDTVKLKEEIPYGELTLINAEKLMTGTRKQSFAFRKTVADARKSLSVSHVSSNPVSGTENEHYTPGLYSCRRHDDFLSTILKISTPTQWAALEKKTRDSLMANLRTILTDITARDKDWDAEKYEDRLRKKRKKTVKQIKSCLSTEERKSLRMKKDGSMCSMLQSLAPSPHLRTG